MTSKFARRAALATGRPSTDGLLREPRSGFVGWFERLLVRAQAPFFLGARTSQRSNLWVLAYQTLNLPLSLWRHVHHFVAIVEETEIQVVCVGRRKRFRDLLDGLFGPVEPAEVEPGTARRNRVERIGGMKPRWAWRPGKIPVPGADLVLVDVHPWFTRAYRIGGWRIVPENVRWQGDLPQLPPPQPPETLRSDMRKVDRYGYRLEEAEGEGDWAEFIDEMARPHTRARYGERAWFPGRSQLEHHQTRGRLLFVRTDEGRVAGACVLPTPSGLWLSIIGTRDGDERWAREGALSAVYLMTFDWARQRGFHRLDAGTTRPFASDGVARYKAKLGLAPAPNPLAFTNALRVDPECAPLAELLRAEPVFCLTEDGIEVFPRAAGGRSEPALPSASGGT